MNSKNFKFKNFFLLPCNFESITINCMNGNNGTQFRVSWKIYVFEFSLKQQVTLIKNSCSKKFIFTCSILMSQSPINLLPRKYFDLKKNEIETIYYEQIYTNQSTRWLSIINSILWRSLITAATCEVARAICCWTVLVTLPVNDVARDNRPVTPLGDAGALVLLPFIPTLSTNEGDWCNPLGTLLSSGILFS